MVFLKWVWWIIINLDLLLLWGMVVALILWAIGFKKGGQRCLLWMVVPYLFLSLTPCGRWMITHLENRFEAPSQLPEDIQGAILLGGSFALKETSVRGIPVYNQAAGRLLEFLEIAHRHPQISLLITGTSLESSHTVEILKRHHIDMNRVIVEDASKNTLDNARLSFEKIHPGKEKWLLVTSGFHMPRSVGLFRKAGWNVVPYPVDFHTTGHFDGVGWGGLDRLNTIAFSHAIRQWAGLINNYLETYADCIFPSPESV